MNERVRCARVEKGIHVPEAPTVSHSKHHSNDLTIGISCGVWGFYGTEYQLSAPIQLLIFGTGCFAFLARAV